METEVLNLTTIPFEDSEKEAINAYKNNKPFFLTYKGTAYETNNIDEFNRAINKNFTGLNGYPVPKKVKNPKSIKSNIGKVKSTAKEKTNTRSYNIPTAQGEKIIDLMSDLQGSANGNEQKYQPNENAIDNSGRNENRFDDMLTDQAPRLDEQAPVVNQEIVQPQIQPQPQPQSPQTLNEKLNDLIKLAETKKIIDNADKNNVDISGDAFFHDVLRGNYITSSGGQGKSTPIAAQTPAFRPKMREEEYELANRGLITREQSVADAIARGAIADELNRDKFNVDKSNIEFMQDYRDRNLNQARLLSLKRIQQGDRALTNSEHEFLKNYELNKLKLEDARERFDKNYGQAQQRIDFSKYAFNKNLDENVRQFNETSAQRQQGLNLQEFQMLQMIKDHKFDRAKDILKIAIQNGHNDYEYLSKDIDTMVNKNMIDKESAEVLKRIVKEPSLWEKFKNIFNFNIL